MLPQSRVAPPAMAALVAAFLAIAGGPVTTPTTAAPPHHPNQPDPTPPPTAARVLTTEGPVVGMRFADVAVWKGIPYAAPPMGALRWRAPQPPAQRDGALNAYTFGPACPQDDRPLLGGAGGRKGAEDCLTLNVWAPSAVSSGQSGPVPVLFWIHGGGHVQGSGSEAIYDGASLAVGKNVVVVTINYRLGALGFLVHEAFHGEHADHPTAGNWGRLDQIEALRWVRANIGGFGGDTSRIAIFGESAGGVGVCDLMVSPLARGLFAAAIMQSGSCLAAGAVPIVDQPRGALPPAADQGRRFAAAIGCADAPDVAACLRGKPVDAVLATLPGEVGILKPGAETYGPIVDRHVLAEAPADAFAGGREHPVPFLLGANADEGTVFLSDAMKAMTAAQVEALVRALYRDNADAVLALYPPSSYASPGLAIADITGDIGFVCPARRTARRHAGHGHPAFLYHFTYVSAIARQLGLGAFHGSEIPFVFGNTGQGGGTRLPPAVQALSDAMRGFWVNLATHGAPGTIGGVAWPAYDAVADVGLRLDTPPGIETGWRDAKCDLWDAVAARDAGSVPTAVATGTGTPRATASPTATATLPAATATATANSATIEPTPTSAGSGIRVFMPYAAGRAVLSPGGRGRLNGLPFASRGMG